MNQDRRYVQTALASTAFHDPQRGKRKNECMLCRPSEYLYLFVDKNCMLNIHKKYNIVKYLNIYIVYLFVYKTSFMNTLA